MGGDFFYPVQRRYRISVAAQLRNTALGFHLYDSVLVETYTIWRQGFHVNSFLFFFLCCFRESTVRVTIPGCREKTGISSTRTWCPRERSPPPWYSGTRRTIAIYAIFILDLFRFSSWEPSGAKDRKKKIK